MSSWFSRVAVPATIALVTLAACGQTEARFQHHGTPGYVAIGTDGGTDPHVTFDPASAEQHGRIIGPNFSLTVSGYSVTYAADADDAAIYGFTDGPVTVAPEHELFAAFIAPDSIGATGDIDATVAVNDDEIPLDHLPGPGETLAAVVPVNADVVLTVTDEDRTQQLSLRHGTRPEAVEGFYTGRPESASPRGYQAAGVATGDAGSGYVPVDREVSISMTVGSAQRSPWHDEHGWAADDAVWVSVPVTDLATDAVWGFDTGGGSHEPKMYWELTEADLFRLTFDGETAEPEGDTVFTVDADTPYEGGADSPFAPASADIVFEVPMDVLTVVFEVRPGGELAAEWADIAGSGSWKDRPEKGEFDFTF